MASATIREPPTAAFFVLHNIYPGTTYFAFKEDMQKQAFGKEITMTDPGFEPFTPVAFAFDVKTNTGVLRGGLTDK